MQDSADQLMTLWLRVPNELESKIEHKIKDQMGQFDLHQPAMKGIAKMENGDQVPFVCFRVHIAEGYPDKLNDFVGAVLNTFKSGGKWKASLEKGQRASFKDDDKSEMLLKGVKELLSRGKMEVPGLHFPSM